MVPMVRPKISRPGEKVSKMFHPSDRQIPADIREAFDHAVLALLHWKRGAKEPSVTLNGGPCPISTIFGRAALFKEPMPANTVVFLHEYASRLLVRQEQDVELEEDPSYEAGARCLLQWVKDNKSEFGQ
jgi:hypothetical protein